MKRHQVYHVARREFLARVRNKAFVLTTILVPAFLVLYTFILPLLFRGTTTEELKLGLLDVGTAHGERVKEALAEIEKPKISIVREASVESARLEEIRTAWSDAIRNEELDGYLVLEKGDQVPFVARYYARETGNIVILSRLERAVRSVMLGSVLEGSGVPLEKVMAVQRTDLDVVRVSEKGEETGGFGVAFFGTFAVAMLLYMAVLINGQGMAMAIVEEKSSHLIEVILGAVTALEFMTGKIVGVLLSGLVQLGIWVGCAIIGLIYVLPGLAVAMPPEFDLSRVIDLQLLVYFCVFFVLGYLLYTTVFAAVAATCTSTEELNQAMFPAMLPLILAFFGVFFVIPNPASLVTRVLSLIPVFTPLVMLARISVLTPPFWEILLGILLLALAVVGAFWLCAKIFRFALLIHGKRVTVPEIVRLLRSA